MSASPSQRTLQECRRLGYRAHVVEKWIPQAGRRIDLFGFIDVVALDGQPGLLGIQATSGSNASKRVDKILAECRDAAREWLEAGNRIECWGWAKRGPAGKRKLWTVRRVEVTIDMLTGAA